jgi:hypothetical protein
VIASIAAINAILIRPFRQRVDLETVSVAFVLLLAVAGGWSIVLDEVR